MKGQLDMLLKLFCPVENVFNLFSIPELSGMTYMDVRRQIHDVIVFSISDWINSLLFCHLSLLIFPFLLIVRQLFAASFDLERFTFTQVTMMC